MTSSKTEPIRKSVVVNADVERAFALFIDRFDAIKPREHNLLSVPIAETIFEPRVGGHIYDAGVDGSRCEWARVLVYEPPSRVVFSWDIGPTWKLETDPPGQARSRSGFSPSPLTAPGLSWSIDTLTATATAGEPSPMESVARPDGRFISTATSTWRWRRRRDERRRENTHGYGLRRAG